MPRLLLLRHGESTWNAEGRWQGHADPPLSERGVAQARAAGPPLAGCGWAGVVSSPLRRAWRTAELLDLGPPEEAAWLQERSAGEWEGLTRQAIDEGYPGWLAEGRRPDGYETDEPLLARLKTGLADLVGRDGPLVAVAHGGVIGALERDLGLERERVPNLGGRWFVLDDDGLRADGPRVELAPAEAPDAPGGPGGAYV